MFRAVGAPEMRQARGSPSGLLCFARLALQKCGKVEEARTVFRPVIRRFGKSSLFATRRWPTFPNTRALLQNLGLKPRRRGRRGDTVSGKRVECKKKGCFRASKEMRHNWEIAAHSRRVSIRCVGCGTTPGTSGSEYFGTLPECLRLQLSSLEVSAERAL